MILPPHNRGDLSAAQWKRIASNLPPQKPAVGRPNNDHQTIINGILWVLRTGAPWRDIPESYGPRHSVSGRFYRWRKKGIWRPHLTKAATIAERSGKINWAIHFVDGSVVRAHQHAAGARRGELDPNNNLSAIAPWRRLPSSNVSSTRKTGALKKSDSLIAHVYLDGGILPPNPLGAASPPPFTPLRSASLRFSVSSQ